MSYWDYIGELMRYRLKLNWPLPHIWAVVNGLETLQTVVEEVGPLRMLRQESFPEVSTSADTRCQQPPNSADQKSDDAEDDALVRTGFLCRSLHSNWYWILTRPHYQKIREGHPEHIKGLLVASIPPDTGMVGALNEHILSRDKERDGGVFNTLSRSGLLEMGDYPRALADIERLLWPSDEFIGEFFLGAVGVEEGEISYDSRPISADSVKENELAVVFAYCAGREPFDPRDVFTTYTAIIEIKRFFWRFLKEYGPRLREASDALMRSAVASIMARNMSHNIGSHVSQRASIECIQQRLADLYKPFSAA